MIYRALIRRFGVGSKEKTAATEAPVTVIRPSHGWVSLKLHELGEYRDLFYFLVWRDVKTRYAQSILGIGWAVIQPVFSMVVFLSLIHI